MNAQTADVRPVIREYTMADREQVEKICRMSFDGIYAFFAIRSLNSKADILVAESDKIVVGFAVLRRVRIRGETIGNILWVAVHPDHRRGHIASSLVDRAIENLEGIGVKEIFISTERGNSPALTMFHAMGFKDTGLRELSGRFGFRVLSFYSRLWIAPHEKVLVRREGQIRGPSSI